MVAFYSARRNLPWVTLQKGSMRWFNTQSGIPMARRPHNYEAIILMFSTYKLSNCCHKSSVSAYKGITTISVGHTLRSGISSDHL